MSAKERDRLDVMSRVKRKELTVLGASQVLGLSLRQTRRVWKRFKSQGDDGLLHGLRGRRSNRRLDEASRKRIIKLHQEHYSDFGPTLACEKLAEEHELNVSPDTLVNLLKEQGLWRRRGRHRQRRERRSCLGALVRMDGSHHDWFEGRRKPCVLMVMVDDATGLTFAWFYEGETTEAAFDVFGRYAAKHGLPRAVYVDRHGIYRDEDHPEKPTQFGRAMAELNVELILAGSPQAKGRVERKHGLFQDRLVKELRLRRISDIEQANKLLEGKFLDEINRRYAVRAAKQTDLHRTVHPKLDLKQVLCVQDKRVVGRDWCVRWRNRILQIDADHAGLALAGKSVLVKQLADRSLVIEHQRQVLQWQERSTPRHERSTPRHERSTPRQERSTPRHERSTPTAPARSKPMIVNNKRWKPPQGHPWLAPINPAPLRRTG
jgi:transposase